MIVSLDGTVKVTRNVTSGAQESVTISDVAPESHTVSVVFDDRQGTVLYSGQTTVSVSSGQQASATVTVTSQNRRDPAASFTVTPSSGPPTTTFAGDASASSDLHDALANLQMRWDWGDGTTSTGRTATHQYTTAGVKTVKLTVTNTANRSATREQTITVAELPRPKMAARLDKNSVTSGDKFTVTVSATNLIGVTGYTAEALYDFNAVADPATAARLPGATSPGKNSGGITTVLGFNRRAETAGTQLPLNPFTGDTDVAAFEFTAKPGFVPTSIGIRRLILRAGSKIDTIVPSPSPLVLQVNILPRPGTHIAARLDKIAGVTPGDKVTLTISVTGASGITGYTAEALYDFNAVADPTTRARLPGATSPGSFPEAITAVPGFNRRAETPGAQLPRSPFTGNTDIATFEFTTKANFTTTRIGIRRLILRAGAKTDTITPSPSPMVLQINP